MRIAIASSYGLPGEGVERAFDAGVSWFFWGALRHGDFGAALARLAKRRRDAVSIATVSYARHPLALRASVAMARRRLGVDALDLLVLGYAKSALPPALIAAAVSLRASGAVRSLGVSSHDRAWLAQMAGAPWLDAVMSRYSAAHPAAETSIFPFCGDKKVLSYTATRWGTLLDPARVPPGERVPLASDCYRFVLSNPRVDLCLAGPRDLAELGAALDAGKAGAMSPDERAWMLRVGEHVRRTARAPEPRSSVARRIAASARSLLTRGVTEEIVSRLNR